MFLGTLLRRIGFYVVSGLAVVAKDDFVATSPELCFGRRLKVGAEFLDGGGLALKDEPACAELLTQCLFDFDTLSGWRAEAALPGSGQLLGPGGCDVYVGSLHTYGSPLGQR